MNSFADLIVWSGLYSMSHSLPNPAGWPTAAPCHNN